MVPNKIKVRQSDVYVTHIYSRNTHFDALNV